LKRVVFNNARVKQHNGGLEIIGVQIKIQVSVYELTTKFPLISGIRVRMRQQSVGCRSLQNGRNIIVNFRPTIDVKNVAPLFEKLGEQMVFVVLEQFVSEFSTLGVCLVYFRNYFFRKNNVFKVFNQYLFMRFYEWMIV